MVTDYEKGEKVFSKIGEKPLHFRIADADFYGCCELPLFRANRIFVLFLLEPNSPLPIRAEIVDQVKSLRSSRNLSRSSLPRPLVEEAAGCICFCAPSGKMPVISSRQAAPASALGGSIGAKENRG